MKFEKTIMLKNGVPCTIRNGEGADGDELLFVFQTTHAETDHLMTYPDENTFDAASEAAFLQEKTDSDREIELLAVVDGKVVGSAGFEAVGTKDKLRHRADFGIAVLRDYWGLGIGRALTQCSIVCARAAGYHQLELTVVADNTAAVALYRSLGFVEYGLNPMGFLARDGRYQALSYMRLAL